MGQCYTTCYNQNPHASNHNHLAKDIKKHRKNNLTQTSLESDYFAMKGGSYLQTGGSRKASLFQMTGQYECSGDANHSITESSVKAKSFIKGKRNSIDKGSINCMPSHMKNRNLFLEDYSKEDLKAQILNDSPNKLKVAELIEQKVFYNQVRASIQERVNELQTQKDQLENGNQQFVQIGNKVKGAVVDRPLDLRNSSKLIIEVKYVQINPYLNRKDKPIVTLFQPSTSVPEDIQSFQNLNSQTILVLNSNNFEHLANDRSDSTSAVSMFIKQSSTHNELSLQSEYLKKPSKKPKLKKFKSVFQTFAGGKLSSQKSESHIETLDRFKSTIDNDFDNKMIDNANDEIFYSTQVPKVVETIKKKTNRRLAKEENQPEFQTYQIYEAFVFYYDKQSDNQGDKQFSIQLNISQGKEYFIVGKKQTFQLQQFKNGQIFEKDISFGSNNLSSIDLSYSNKKDYSAKVSLKIQYIENEIEKINEAIFSLEEKCKECSEKNLEIDEILQKHYSDELSMKRRLNETPQSKTTASGSKEQQTLSSKKSHQHQDEPDFAFTYQCMTGMSDRISLREQHQSQAAGFFQCQLNFLDEPQTYEEKDRVVVTEQLRDFDIIEHEDFRVYSETQPIEEVEKEFENDC